MKHVYAIFTECDDSFYGPDFVCCYSNKEEAEKHNATISSYRRLEVLELKVYDTYAEAKEDTE